MIIIYMKYIILLIILILFIFFNYLNIYKNLKYEYFSSNGLKLIKSINITRKIYYPRIFQLKNNYYFSCRISKNKNRSDIFSERIILYKIDLNNLSINRLNKEYNFQRGATHNIQFYNISDKLIGIGGRGYINKDNRVYKKVYNDFFINKNNFYYYNKNNQKFFNYNNIDKERIPHFIKPDVNCSFFSNGLYKFDIKDDIDNLDNNYTYNKIITNLTQGRNDGYWGNNDGKNIKDGLTYFDSNNSLVYNIKNKKYYLYFRANLAKGVRNIQYSTSYDLLNWSSLKLIKLHNVQYKNILHINIYINNFFYLKEVNKYIGLLSITKPDSDHNIEKSFISLYISDDCENWHFKKNIFSIYYPNEFLICGKPILYENNYLFFIVDNTNLYIKVYKINKNIF
jgi:hypothetical protein